jgi:hypothetical protein
MSEKLYMKHINDWCLQCTSGTTNRNCKKCYLPDISDNGEIGKPSWFEEKKTDE